MKKYAIISSMKLYSTRNKNEIITPKDAIIRGLSLEGGLYSPLLSDIKSQCFNIEDLLKASYKDISKIVFKTFLSDFTDEEIETCINNAYGDSNFGAYKDNIAPTTKIGNHFLLELYHGPTSAFKDMALTILPQFLTTAYKSKGSDSKVYILTATSGDTGKAALSGFRDVPNVFITVFYPTDGVSGIQKMQMQTSEGNNVSVVALNGDFDDCQRLVKEIYTDEKIKELCFKNKVVLSSANSINIGRLVPQIVYYINSYVELVRNNNIKLYDKVNFIVPTGNFGDILAGFIAKNLGLPINRLICASNDNNVLTDFIETGIYNKNRKLYKTISPSMDILVSSNLERLLFLLSDGDSTLIKSLMNVLNTKGTYTVSDTLLSRIKEHFSCSFANENECRETIKDAYFNDKRLIDTHTAVAYACLKKYLKNNSDDKSVNVILSTASPYKFARAVLPCIIEENVAKLDDFECIDKLYTISNEPIPQNLSTLRDKAIRFNDTLSYDACKSYVTNKIGGLND